MWVWEGQRERERESQAGSVLTAKGSVSQTMKSWPEPKSRVSGLTWLGHSGAPIFIILEWRGPSEAKYKNQNPHEKKWQIWLHETWKLQFYGEPGWLSQLSIWLLISPQVMIPGLWDQAPRQALCRQHRTCLGFSLSLSLSLSLSPLPLLTLYLKINKHFKKRKGKLQFYINHHEQN